MSTILDEDWKEGIKNNYVDGVSCFKLVNLKGLLEPCELLQCKWFVKGFSAICI